MGLAAFNRARRIRAEQEAAQQAVASEGDGLAALTVAELKERLTAQGIEFPARANKADLIALLEQG